jgi:exonuclease III
MTDVWNELKSFLNPEVFQGIKSLKKVQPKNRPPRLDMQVTRDIASGLKRTIRAMTQLRTPKFTRAARELMDEGARWRTRPLSLWRIDLWKDWRDRPTIARPPVIAVPQSRWRHHIATLNVNGFARKRLDVIELLTKEQISICALQETLVSSRAFPVQMPGYVSYTQHWGEGFRGQTLLVKSDLSSYEVGREARLYIHVKVSGLPRITQPVHVIAVYLPSGGEYRGLRTELFHKLLALNKKILDATPGAPVIFLGDWNMNQAELEQKLQTPLTGLQVYKPVGSALSRFPTRGLSRDIDHMVVSAGMNGILRRPRVNRKYGISDHRPLIAPLRAVVKDNTPQAPQWRYDNYAIKRFARELVYSNRWSVLDVEEANDGDRLNEDTESFVKTMDQLTRSFGMKKLKVPGKPKFPKTLVKLVTTRNKMAKKLADSVLDGSEPTRRTRQRFLYAQKRFSKARDAWQIKNDRKVIEYTCRDIQACDYKKVWARIKQKIEHDGASEALQPVRNKTGTLCVTNDDILEAIADHYDRLANADPGPSQDAAHWANIDIGEPSPEMETLNGELTWTEILLSIRRMNRNTSPGSTGEHVNVMKELLNEECMAEVLRSKPNMRRPEKITFALGSDELPQWPLTPLGKALFHVLTSIWKLEQIPDLWNEVHICNLFKSGNPELMVNYRGISLISVGLKVLLGVMADRLYKGCEQAQFLVPEQSGFRRKEEAIAQYIAIAEIARRRGIEGKATYAIFVDFKKAFDKVHHEALYRILDNMGVRGKFLEVIKNMYRNSKMTVKAGGKTTRSYGMKRGNRQGCPLSPLLFIIFINHLLGETSCGGVTVAGVKKNQNIATCAGGQYADDLVALEATAEAAEAFCMKIYEWGRKWGMELGVTKCGVMLWSEDEGEMYDYALATFTTPDGDLPKVDEYKYLGIEMQKNLPQSRAHGGNELDFVKRQAKKGEKALNAIRPLLRNPDWPIPVKIALIRTLVLSVMIYGAEWVGYKQLHAQPIQRVITKAMKLAMGNSSKSKAFDYMTLSYELGMPTVEEEQAALRARLSAKLQFTDGIKTWLKTLYDQPLKSMKRTWVTTTKAWEKSTLRGLNKYDGMPLRPWAAKGHEYEIHTRCNQYRSVTVDNMRDARNEVDRRGAQVTEPPEGVHRYMRGLVPVYYDPVRERSLQILETTDAQTKTPAEWEYIANIRDCVLERAMTANRTVNWAFYNRWAFGTTRGYLRASTAYPSLTQGIAWLVRVRCRAFPRVRDCWNRTIRSGKTPDFARTKCPLCKEEVEDGMEWEHLLISCQHSRVRTARYIHLEESIQSLKHQLMSRPDIVLDGDVDNNRRALPVRVSLERAIAVHLVGGVVNYDFNVNYHLGFGALDDLPEGQTSHGYIYVGKFLSEVAPLYVTALFKRSPYFENQDDLQSNYTYSAIGDPADHDSEASFDSQE